MISTISALLESHLDIIAKKLNLPVFDENSEILSHSDIYLRTYILPEVTTSVDSEGKLKVYRGVYQISVVAPINSGKLRSQQISDEIIQHFPLNLELTSHNFSLYVNSIPSVYPAKMDNACYTLSISFNYRADSIF